MDAFSERLSGGPDGVCFPTLGQVRHSDVLAQLSPQMTTALASMLNEFIRSSKPGPSGKDDVEFLAYRNRKALSVCFKLPIFRIILYAGKDNILNCTPVTYFSLL